ncbi:deformed epidermal autoregulatory factor 1 homolog isoform X2 [Pomacea canaliculata]|uniref:deformed epidermal autoregulatory factor 1 homolog isoform X2 n=1 Tax=Pomacea canaliculata TaxID=400727 RepID=UPI000D7362EA|nr:deformed epidermal autoregulatory factor 1 homolog isoform X2 [Pomacea canaliculata]
MSEVDISEEIPNGDDSAFVEEQSHEAECDSAAASRSAATVVEAAPQDAIAAEHVFVATPQGLLTAEQFQEATVAGIKTTHIVIHDQTIGQLEGLKTPTTPLPPPTPATPLSKEKGFKYNWDDSVHQSVLPVRCKTTNGELYKAKFGSGGRGKCIKGSDEMWYTPNEFEALAGRASSKDWKRSIRYGGRTLQCLIEDGILQPHATSCTCAACCDDDAVVSNITGPVRLFVPYKRRKKDSESDNALPSPKKLRTAAKSPTITASPMAKEVSVSPVPSAQTAFVTSAHRPLTIQSESGETVHIVATDAQGNLVTDAVVMTPLTLAQPHIQGIIQQQQQQHAQQHQQQIQQQTIISKAGATVVSMDVLEQKQWWHLEEMANNLLQQVQQLKIMIEQVKQQTLISKEAVVQQTRQLCEKEKNEALNAARIEAQMNLSRVVMDQRAQKDIAVQQALAQARAEMQEKMDSVTVISDDKVTYNVTWNTSGSQPTITTIMDTGVEEDSDKEKE